MPLRPSLRPLLPLYVVIFFGFVGYGLMITVFSMAVSLACIVGPLARFVVPGDDSMPIWMTIVLGAVGAFLGGWLLAEVITPDNKGVPWIAAILAGAALVVVVRLVRRGTTGTTRRQVS